jgi:hypothetical protein
MVYLASQKDGISIEEEAKIMEATAVVMNADINVPLLDEADEGIIFLTFWKWIASLIRKWLTKNK